MVSASQEIDLEGPREGPRSGGTPRQLVVLLHGLGANGQDLIALAPVLGQVLPDAVFVAPDAPSPCDMAPFGYQWFSLQLRTPESLYEGAEGARPVLERFIDAELARYGLGDEHLVLIGFSQGTMMALHTALRRPRACACVIGYSGLLVGGERLAEETVSRPPVLLVHGDADEVVSPQALPAAVEALKGAGVEVEGELRPGLGHGIDEAGIALAARFLKDVFADAAAD
jgi:phospholipase/carboxylesterase